MLLPFALLWACPDFSVSIRFPVWLARGTDEWPWWSHTDMPQGSCGYNCSSERMKRRTQSKNKQKQTQIRSNDFSFALFKIISNALWFKKAKYVQMYLFFWHIFLRFLLTKIVLIPIYFRSNVHSTKHRYFIIQIYLNDFARWRCSKETWSFFFFCGKAVYKKVNSNLWCISI